MGDRGDYQNRLREMLAKDVGECVFGLDKLIKSEMINVLKNYFKVSNDDVDIAIFANDEGKYVLTIRAELKGVKQLKKII